MADNYDEFHADRRTLGYRGQTGLPTEVGLANRLARRLQEADPADVPAIKAAHERLLEWAKSGRKVPRRNTQKPQETEVSARTEEGPEPLPETPPERAGDAAKRAEEEGRAIWAMVLDAQLARHIRRRARYPEVLPKRTPFQGAVPSSPVKEESST